jgi:hypothetical protein
MKNLITELLLKLAQKEEESQDLAAQVATLERQKRQDLADCKSGEKATEPHGNKVNSPGFHKDS